MDRKKGRDDRGRFVRGTKPGPGRPKAEQVADDRFRLKQPVSLTAAETMCFTLWERQTFWRSLEERFGVAITEPVRKMIEEIERDAFRDRKPCEK